MLELLDGEDVSEYTDEYVEKLAFKRAGYVWCKRCCVWKDQKEFYRLEKCKACAGKFLRDWKRANPDRVQASSRKYNYGVSATEWTRVFTRQGSCCAICKSPEPKSSKGWHTDHDHETGRLRGILCRQCNLALGYFELVIKPNMQCVEEYLL